MLVEVSHPPCFFFHLLADIYVHFLEWASFDSGAFIQWNTTTSSSGNVIYHTVQKQSGEVESMVENDGMAEDLAFYYGALAVSR